MSAVGEGDDEPKYVGFLRILAEFSMRLNPADAKQMYVSLRRILRL